MMSLLVVAAIVLAVALGYTTKINIGLFAIAFAYLLGCFGMGLSPGDIIGMWPLKIFFVIFSVCLFYSFATVNGTLEKLAGHLLYRCRGVPHLLPYAIFVTGSVISGMGAGYYTVLAFMAPLTLLLCQRTGMSLILGGMAVNYGAIGGVIGHEIIHGFDDQGRKSDGKGVLRDWWTAEDAAKFEVQAARLGAQYEAYAFPQLPGMHINGRVAMGENIGDLGGLTIALEAYHRSLGGKPAPVIDGFTGDQRFFMGWGQVWRTLWRDDALRQQLVNGTHSPGHIRAFAFFGASVACCILLHAIVIHPWFWMGLRVLTGVGLVGFYAVIESWLNDRTAPERRGQVFAVYMVVNLAALAGAQQMLRLDTPAAFTLFAIAAVCVGAASTWLSFGLLGLSATPALRAFGLTLLFGIGLVWLISPLFRPPPHDAPH